MLDPVIADASLAAGHQLPATLTASSAGLGWRSLLVCAYDDPDETEGFTTAPTPDLLVVLNLSGNFTIEARRPGGWTRAAYRPGAIGVTAPGRSATLRWHAEASEPRRSLHVFLSAELLLGTAEGLGRPQLLRGLPDALHLEDPVVAATGRALQEAVAQRSDALHAEALAQALALHLIYGRLLGGRRPSPPRGHGALTGSALGRVLDHMHDHLATDLALDDLAALVPVSKFHFLRLFRQATGATPHRHLAGLRMERGAELLRSTQDSVQQVSSACGYASPGQFATAFRRHHGVTPTQYRRDTQR